MYFIQRESNNQQGVNNNSGILFDTGVSLSHSDDFGYQPAGIIDIKKPGVYVVSWFVAQMTGLSKNRQIFEVMKSYDDFLTRTSVVGASNNAKISSSSGFASITVTKDEIEDYGYVSIALFNISGAYATFTEQNHTRAGILVFGLDMEAIYEELRQLRRFVYLSDVTRIWSIDPVLGGRGTITDPEDPCLYGIGTGIIHAGYNYNFWGIGCSDHIISLDNQTTYRLVTNNLTITQCPELLLYQGDTTIGTLWVETPNGDRLYNFPLRFDATGIYFRPTQNVNGLPVGTTFKFTQALILSPP